MTAMALSSTDRFRFISRVVIYSSGIAFWRSARNGRRGALPWHFPRPDAVFSHFRFPNHFFSGSRFIAFQFSPAKIHTSRISWTG
jgi:hypothetical protein